ncbi:MAG: aldehyde dehydrogenase family protein [Saprospiraceae bacterium]
MDYTSGRPRRGIVGDTYALTSDAELSTVLDASSAWAKTWATSTIERRVSFCRKAAEALKSNRDALAELASIEMGKRLDESLSEVDKCASLCNYYADHLAEFLSPSRVVDPNAFISIHERPLGIILGVMPWNFPYWQATRFAIPAIAAGNLAVLKHAPNVPACAEAFAKTLEVAAEGDPLITNVRLTNEQVAGLIADDRIAGVSLTGSTGAGRVVAAAAGKALKPSVLELGGSDPYLILADADIDLAVAACFAGRLLNAGQSCISAKRLIVDQSIVEAFTAAIKAKTDQLRFLTDDPSMDHPLGLAPMARADLRDHLHAQVTESLAQGATCVLGGDLPNTEGYFYPATILAEVAPGMAAFDEELFGPVIVICPARDTEHAIALANNSKYGLGAAVFSKDLLLAEEIASARLEAGACFVNTYVRSDQRLPFGGVKQSGYGRELAREGLLAFTNTKVVWVEG